MTRSYHYRRSYVRRPQPPDKPTKEEVELEEAEARVKGGRETLKSWIYRMREKSNSPITERWKLYKQIDRRLELDEPKPKRRLNADALAGHNF